MSYGGGTYGSGTYGNPGGGTAGTSSPGSETLEYEAGDGVITDLSNQEGLFVKVGIDGRFGAPLDIVTEALPLHEGAQILTLRRAPRNVDVAGVVLGGTRAEVRSRIRTMARDMNARKGDGILRHTNAAGQTYELHQCRLIAGLEGLDTNTGRVTHQPVVFGFRAYDPYWYSTAPVVVNIDANSAGSWFPFNGFPSLVSSTAFGSPNVSNDGDVEAYPFWIVTGPGESLVLRNYTTGFSFALNYTIPAGSWVYIDTSPGNKTVVDNSGNNLFGFTTGSLWALGLDSNELSIELDGVSAASRVQLRYYERLEAV